MKVTFKEYTYIGRYKRIERKRTVHIERSFRSGGLLYGYTDRFNVISIPIEDITNIVPAM